MGFGFARNVFIVWDYLERDQRKKQPCFAFSGLVVDCEHLFLLFQFLLVLRLISIIETIPFNVASEGN